MAQNSRDSQFTSFYIREKRYMLDIRLIKEINSEFKLTSVPLAPNHVGGVINLRGTIVTVIDLGYCLGLGKTVLGENTHCLISKHKSDLVDVDISREDQEEFMNDSIGLLVDNIGDILKIEGDQMEATPPNLDNGTQNYILNVLKLENEIVAHLDLLKVLKIQEQQESQT